MVNNHYIFSKHIIRMQNKLNYSRLTLKPLDAHESHLFWQFRMDDVYEMYRFSTIIIILFGFAQVAMFILSPDLTTFIDGVCTSLLVVLTILVYIFGSQMPRQWLQICITAFVCFCFVMAVVQFTLISLYAEASKADKTLILKQKLSSYQSALFFVSMFNFSSMAHLIICMLCAALSFFALDSWLLLGADDESKFYESVLEIPVYMLSSFAIWYILQRRELKSFIRERKAEIK